MTACRKTGLSAVVISVALSSASCSLLPGIDGTVDDNIRYRSSDATIKALAIPPGLSRPDFNETYRVPATPVGGNAVTAGKKTVEPNKPAQPRIRVALSRLKSGDPMLAVDTSLDNSWPLIAAMLPNIGFKVLKQQPAEGLYTVKYQGIAGEKPSWTDKLNSMVSGVTIGKTDGLRIGQTYLIALSGNQAQQSFVFVADAKGKPAAADVANKVLGRLKAEFER